MIADVNILNTKRVGNSVSRIVRITVLNFENKKNRDIMFYARL